MFKTERRQEYKKGIDSSEQRRKRTENTIELRKNKRDEQLTKRRVHGDQPFQFGAAADNNSENNVKVNQQDQYTLNDLNMLVQHMCNSDPQLQLKATKGIRRLLSIESNPPIDEVMAAGVLPIVVKMLPMVNHPELIFEAAWVLTNMASGTSKHVRQLIEAGTVQSFVALLNTPNLTADVYDQVAWAIGNIAGDNIQCRDFVLKCGALAPLIRLCENRRNNLSRLRDAVWVISNLCRGKPQPDFELIKGVVPLLSSVLESKDAEVLTDACWALSYISDDNTKNNIKIQAIIESGVVQRVVHLLLHHDSNIKTPCLRTVGNMVTGNDAQTQHVLDCGMLPALKQLLVSGKKSIRKEACWAISNVTAGTPQQIQSVIDAGLLPSLVQILGASEHDVRKEVAWVVSNIVASGREDQIRALTEFSVLPPLCELLKSSDSALVIACLDSLSSILAIGQKDAMRNGGDNAYSIILESCGGVDDLALLQDSEQQEVQSKASTILNAYFDAEEEVGDACNIAPAVTGNQFSFGDSTSTSFSFGANTNSQPFSF